MPVKKVTKKVVKEKKRAPYKAIDELRPIGAKKLIEFGIVNTHTSQGDIDLDDGRARDEIDIPPVKDWSRFKPQNEVDETPINYWKYALISILLGIVVGMIISTPHVIKALEVCK